jgi:hypothetical protein
VLSLFLKLNPDPDRDCLRESKPDVGEVGAYSEPKLGPEIELLRGCRKGGVDVDSSFGLGNGNSPSIPITAEGERKPVEEEGRLDTA